MAAVVVNKYKEPNFDCYIGRPSKWANPFPITKTSDRATVIRAHLLYFCLQVLTEKITREDLLGLDGKRLGCFCKPKECHGDTIVEFVEHAKNNCHVEMAIEYLTLWGYEDD